MISLFTNRRVARFRPVDALVVPEPGVTGGASAPLLFFGARRRFTALDTSRGVLRVVPRQPLTVRSET
jgi:hypothetical protein